MTDKPSKGTEMKKIVASFLVLIGIRKKDPPPLITCCCHCYHSIHPGSRVYPKDLFVSWDDPKLVKVLCTDCRPPNKQDHLIYLWTQEGLKEFI